MAIEIEIDANPETDNKKREAKSENITFKMNARRSLDGNIMIMDHIDIDIVYAPGTRKVLTFAKDKQSDIVYAAQNRMFEYLVRNGVVTPGTVRGGNVYGSLEGQVPEPVGGLDATKVFMMSVGKFLEEERPYFMYEKAYKEQEVDMWTDPPADETTELGEVPQAAKKGSIGKLRGYWNV
tara:strand:+ start:1841 stop:2380 length:540 start_codon:yes stop_codon:yes gene_type:complete